MFGACAARNWKVGAAARQVGQELEPQARAGYRHRWTACTEKTRQPGWVDRGTTERLRRWFGTIELEAEVPGAVALALAEMVDMLDGLCPSKLDRSRSAIRASGHDWNTPADGVEIYFAHDTEDDAAVDAVIGSKDALVSWFPTHEHVFPEDGTGERPWLKVTVDLLAAVLSGEYLVESHYRGSRLVKSRVLDVINPGSPRVLSTTGSLLGWLLWWGDRSVDIRRLDYGVRPRSII